MNSEHCEKLWSKFCSKCCTEPHAQTTQNSNLGQLEASVFATSQENCDFLQRITMVQEALTFPSATAASITSDDLLKSNRKQFMLASLKKNTIITVYSSLWWRHLYYLELLHDFGSR